MFDTLTTWLAQKIVALAAKLKEPSLRDMIKAAAPDASSADKRPDIPAPPRSDPRAAPNWQYHNAMSSAEFMRRSADKKQMNAVAMQQRLANDYYQSQVKSQYDLLRNMRYDGATDSWVDVFNDDGPR